MTNNNNNNTTTTTFESKVVMGPDSTQMSHRQWHYVSLAKYVLDNDKLPIYDLARKGERIFKEKILTGEAYDYVLHNLKGHKQQLALREIYNAKQIMAGKPVHAPSGWDGVACGPTLMAVYLRDEKALKNIGTFNSWLESPADLYKSIALEFFKELHWRSQGHVLIKYDKKMHRCRTGANGEDIGFKPSTTQFNYGGVKHILDHMLETIDPNHEYSDQLYREVLNPKVLLDIYKHAYSEVLPLNHLFLENMKASWNEKALHTYWEMPDGMQPDSPICKKWEFKGEGKIPGCKWTASVISEINEPLTKQEEGSKCWGANFTHSTDAYVLHEICRRMNHRGKLWLNQIKNDWLTRKGYIHWRDCPEIKHLVEYWELYGIASTELLYRLDRPTILPEDLKDYLVDIIDNMDPVPHQVAPVHDEFMVLPSGTKALRSNVSRIYAEIYKSNLYQVFGKAAKTRIAVGEYKEDIYQKLLKAEYILA